MMMNTKALQELARRAQAERRELLAVLGSDAGQRVLHRLEERFETNLPVFQGKPGQYDALDAMRRDAHREVFLVIRRQLELAQQEETQQQTDDEYTHE